MYHSQEEPKIHYIYKRGCSNKPVMLNNLSPLHEAKIIPSSISESIHLAPLSKIKKTRKNKTKSKNQKRKNK
jgi:hypothetical protein